MTTLPVVDAMSDVPTDLDGVTRRLREAEVLDLVLGAPYGPGWQSLPEALDALDAWHADLVHHHGDRRAAAAYLAAWVAGTPSLVVGLPAMVGGVVPDVEAAAIRLHRHPQGFVDRHAIAVSGAGQGPEQVVLATAAERIARLTAPLVDRLCEVLPVGPVALWSGVADVIGAYALWFARQDAGDPRQAWSRSQALLDQLVEVAPVRHRPRLFPVAWSGGTAYYPVRSTCCLYYRTEAAAGPDGPTYCTTCPLRADEDRTARLAAHVESTA